MRNITKVVLLLVAVFVVYLLWPRSADLRKFQPDEFAALQVRAWEADRKGDDLGALWARFRIYTSQYGMSPVAALRIAQTQDAGLKDMKQLVKSDDAQTENAALTALTEKYALIKAQLKGAEFNPDTLARSEFTWRLRVLQGADAAAIAPAIAEILAAYYGGETAHFQEVARGIATAQLQAAGASPADSTAAPQEGLRETFRLLKEIADTPAAP